MEKKNIQIAYLAGAPETLAPEDRMLADAARKATESSYSPYSHFQVGAAILLEDGTIVMGSNQENAAYPSGLCAERVTIFSASAQYPGKAMKALAIAAQTGGSFTKAPVTPCGACRQVMTEVEARQSSPLRIILYGTEQSLVFEGIGSLMPFCFGAENMSAE